MFLFIMVTSLFQKPIEVLILNGSSGFPLLYYSPSEDAVYSVYCLVINLLKKHQESKKFFPAF